MNFEDFLNESILNPPGVGKPIALHPSVPNSENRDKGHRFAVTVSEPDHPMVTKRKTLIHKHINVKGETDKAKAQERAHKFYKKRGYKVHSVEHHSELK